MLVRPPCNPLMNWQRVQDVARPRAQTAGVTSSTAATFSCHRGWMDEWQMEGYTNEERELVRNTSF